MAAVFTGFLSIFKIYGFLDESETHSVMGSLPTDHAQLFFPFKKRKDSILELRTIFFQMNTGPFFDISIDH